MKNTESFANTLPKPVSLIVKLLQENLQRSQLSSQKQLNGIKRTDRLYKAP